MRYLIRFIENAIGTHNYGPKEQEIISRLNEVKRDVAQILALPRTDNNEYIRSVVAHIQNAVESMNNNIVLDNTSRDLQNDLSTIHRLLNNAMELAERHLNRD